LFVGSFKDQAADGSVGGQMFACRSLLASRLKDEFQFILIDSTAESVPAPGFLKRLIKALLRLCTFIFYLITKRPHSVLVFSSAGFSFIEKGLMILLAAPFTRTILAPRSGILLDNINASRFFSFYAQIVFRASGKIIAQGHYWESYFRNLIGGNNADKIVVIPNWIDTRHYFPRAAENPPSGKIRIVYIGWLETYKGIYDLIEAARELRSRQINFELNVFGHGSQHSNIQDFIEKNDLAAHIRLRGWIKGEMKMEALQHSDIYILPSHREGFPNALLEAMAMGIPVIASDIGVIPEVVRPGFNGELFKKGSVSDLCEKIESLSKNEELRKLYRANASKTVLERYSIQFAENRVRELLKKCS
jgi:glycosyltransferase involved in cell wall biosynthesis